MFHHWTFSRQQSRFSLETAVLSSLQQSYRPLVEEGGGGGGCKDRSLLVEAGMKLAWWLSLASC